MPAPPLPAALDCRENWRKIRLLKKREIAVKAFLTACLAAIVLAAILWVGLSLVQEQAGGAFATSPYTGVGAISDAAKLLSKDEGRRIAVNIAKPARKPRGLTLRGFFIL